MKRLTRVWVGVLILYFMTSAVFIFSTSVFHSRVATIYRTYLLPGPFFKDSRIVNNYSITVSWKIADKWSVPVNHAAENFKQYHAGLNITDLYRSRLIRGLYGPIMQRDSSIADIRNRKEFQTFRKFLNDHYVPPEADSVRVWIITRQAQNFMEKTDSVCITISR